MQQVIRQLLLNTPVCHQIEDVSQILRYTEMDFNTFCFLLEFRNTCEILDYDKNKVNV